MWKSNQIFVVFIESSDLQSTGLDLSGAKHEKTTLAVKCETEKLARSQVETYLASLGVESFQIIQITKTLLVSEDM